MTDTPRPGERDEVSDPGFRLRVPLRWRDVDTLGHLNQAVYHELLEEARTAMIADLLDWPENEVASLPFVLAHVSMDHRREVRRQEGAVEVRLRLTRVGNSSVRLEHELVRADGSIAASGHTVMVAWDPRARGKRPLTDAERAALTAELAV